MSDSPYLGEIKTFGFGFSPTGHAYCNGALLSIQQNTALFSLLGTTYGGNGTTTFGLPNLQGRSPVGQGTGGGLSSIALGQIAGVENVTLLTSNLPPHTHIATATSALFAEGLPGDNSNPSAKLLAGIPNGYIEPDSTPNVQLSGESVTTSVSIGITGSGIPVGIRNPYLGLNFCIATSGIYPSRN